MDTALRPMTTSQILDRTFYLYRNNFLLFAGIACVGPAMGILGRLIQLAAFGSSPPFQPGSFDPRALLQFFARIAVGTGISIVLYAVGQALAVSATIHAVSVVHLGKTTRIAESYARIKPIVGRILWLMFRVFWLVSWPLLVGYVAALLMIVVAGVLARPGAGSDGAAMVVGIIGVLLLFLGGMLGGAVWAIIASCRYSLAIPACTVENLPAKYAIRRSKFLSRGSIGRIFVIFLLTGVLTFALTLVLQLPALAFFNPFVLNPGPVSGASLFFSFSAEFLGRTLAGPIATIALALLYYDQRVRKEAFDLQLMMEGMGQVGSVQSASAPASGA